MVKFFNRFVKKKTDDEDRCETPQPSTQQFRPFHETYKYIAFAMCVGVLYPNPKTDVHRLIIICMSLVSITPVAVPMLIDMYFCWLRKDFIEIIRHCTILGPFLAIFLKMFLLLLKRKPAEKLLEELNRDYYNYNNYPTEFKALIQAHVDNCLRYTEKWWAVVVVSTVGIFPAMAMIQNIHSTLFTSGTKKYLIHDLNRPFAEPEKRFESPYFEIMFGLMLYSCMFYVANFLGYDGFFGVMINHACLKFTLYGKTVEDAMQLGSKKDITRRIIEAIEQQNRAYAFVNDIQNTFNLWLGNIFMFTIVEICNLLYQFSVFILFAIHCTVLSRNLRIFLLWRPYPGGIAASETKEKGSGFDIRYASFILGATTQIYLPCHYCSKLKLVSSETVTVVYTSGWENVQDQSIRKMVIFMIARGQVPLELSGFNMVRFDMELFVSIIQTSYSMYTLLQS